MVTAVKRPAGETQGKVAAGPDAGQRHRASSRPYILFSFAGLQSRDGFGELSGAAIFDGTYGTYVVLPVTKSARTAGRAAGSSARRSEVCPQVLGHVVLVGEHDGLDPVAGAELGHDS